MRKRVLTTAVLLSAAVAATACSDGGTGPGGGGSRLSAAEAVAVHRAILAFGTGMAQSGAAGARASAQAAGSGSFSFNFSDTHACQPSGSAAVAGTLSGSWNDVARTGQLQATMSVAHQACAVPVQGGVVKLTGDPDIDLTLNATSNAQGLATLRITESGAFTWDRGDGNSGRCTLDVTAELIAGTQNVRLTGSFCGIPLDGTVSGAG